MAEEIQKDPYSVLFLPNVSRAIGTPRTRVSGKPPQTTSALVSGVFLAGVQPTSISQ